MRVMKNQMLVMSFWMVTRVMASGNMGYMRDMKTMVSHTFATETVDSAMQCCASCTSGDACGSVSYHDNDGTCNKNDRNPYNDGRTTTIRVPSDGWTSYYKIEPGTCEPGWTLYSGSCYQLVTDERDWVSSDAHCQSLGAHLVDILDYDELTFVQNLYSGDNYVFIGLNDRTEEGTFVWSTGEPTSILAWNTTDGEPDGGSSQNCGLLFEFSFFDYQCSEPCYSVCEYTTITVFSA